MSIGMAREIKNLLRIMTSTELVADELIKKWHRGVLSKKEIDYLGQFLLDTGMHRSLLSESIYQLQNKKDIPLAACLACINSATEELQLSKKEIDSLFLAAENYEALPYLMRANKIVDKHSRLKKLTELQIEKDIGHRAREFEKIKRQLQSLMKDELWTDASNLIDSLQQEWPEDQELHSMQKEVAYKKALSVLRKHEKSEDYTSRKSLSPNKQSDENNLAESLLQLASEKTEWAYDLSFALFGMDEMDFALQALQYSTLEKKDWLELQILIEAKRFVQALDKIRDKQLSISEPEQINSLNYYEAQALWGLDQSELAIAKLEEILRVRPNFRSAHSLLLSWKATK